MVKIKNMASAIFLRIFLSILIFIVGYFTADPIYKFITGTLGFTYPAGLFHADTIAAAMIALVTSWLIWASIVFGALGKKIDFFFSAIFIIIALIIYGVELEAKMYFLLVGLIISGNLVGYLLKLGRERFLAR